MPTRSPGDVPAGTIRDLGLPARAVSALARAGINSIDDLAVLSRRDLVAISGLGPSMIAAIRVVVPEPPSSAARSAGSPEVPRQNVAAPTVDAEPEAAEDGAPPSPVIPSFDSLRAPRRRTAVDVLVPGPPPARSTPPPARSTSARSTTAGAARPAEYADLLRLGARVIRAAVGLPGRVALLPVRCLQRLLGAQVGSGRATRGDAPLGRE